MPQVEATGEDGVSIPDHEVMTRRKQFRLKKDRAEAKRQQKEEKKIEKRKKKDEKEAKRVAKEAEKAAKAASKKAAKSSTKQAGRKASDKLNERKEKPSKSSSSKTKPKKEASKHDVQEELTPDVRPAVSRQMKRLKKYSKAHDSEKIEQSVDDNNTDPNDNSHEEKHAKQKNMTDPPTCQKDEKDGQDEHGMDQQAEEKQEKGKRSRKTAAKSKANPEAGEAEEKTSKKKQEKPEKAGAKAKAKSRARKAKEESKEDDKTEEARTEKKTTRKRASKQTEKDPETAKKTRTVRRMVETEVDESCRDQVLVMLKECATTRCTHPTWKRIRTKEVDVEPYMTRSACGVKVERRFFKDNKKAQGTGKAHVTYFSGKTHCPYSNHVLGGLWVSRLHPLSVHLNFYIVAWFVWLPAVSPGSIPLLTKLNRYVSFQKLGPILNRGWNDLYNPHVVLIAHAQVKEWERVGKPDPLCDHMVHYTNVLKTSHAAAISEWNSQPSEPNIWFVLGDGHLCWFHGSIMIGILIQMMDMAVVLACQSHSNCMAN